MQIYTYTYIYIYMYTCVYIYMYMSRYIYIYIYINININIVESNKCIEKCASLNLNNSKKREGGGLGGRAEEGP